MALFKMRVVYLDGREVEVVVPPKALIATEDYFHGTNGASEHKIKAHYFTAWAALHRDADPSEFDAWMDTVAEAVDIDPDADDEARSDPTQTEAGTTASST